MIRAGVQHRVEKQHELDRIERAISPHRVDPRSQPRGAFLAEREHEREQRLVGPELRLRQERARKLPEKVGAERRAGGLDGRPAQIHLCDE